MRSRRLKEAEWCGCGGGFVFPARFSVFPVKSLDVTPLKTLGVLDVKM